MNDRAMADLPLRAMGADDGNALRELAFARLLALADDALACACTSPELARHRADMFEACVHSIGSDPALTDIYERLLPVRDRLRDQLASR